MVRYSANSNVYTRYRAVPKTVLANPEDAGRLNKLNGSTEKVGRPRQNGTEQRT
jgi:hypothetical protein